MLSFKAIPAVCLRRQKTQNPPVGYYVSSSMFRNWSSPVFSKSVSQRLTLFFTCLYKCKLMHADPSICLKPLDRWDRRFESRWAHRCSSLVVVVYCIGSGLCEGWSQVQRSPAGYVCARAFNCVWFINIKTRRLGPNLGCSPTEKEMALFPYIDMNNFVSNVRTSCVAQPTSSSKGTGFVFLV